MAKPVVTIVTKIARMYEGEYIFVSILGAFHLKENAEKFLQSKNTKYGENINGIDCVVELGIIQNVEVLDSPEE